MSAEEELRNDYINDLVDMGNLDQEQIHITSVDLLNSVTGQYKITSEIEFFDLDENAVQSLVTKINDKSAFTRLKEKHGSIESVPQATKKQFSESDPKPKMIATKKKPDGTIVEKVETIRRKTGRVRERKFNPNDETDILETTEISAEDENGDKIRETFFKDQRRRRVRFKANNESNVLETTEVSAPDQTTGDVTTKVTQVDGSYVETVNDSSDVVKNTTEASAPDTVTGNVTITVTDNVTGQSSTYVNEFIIPNVYTFEVNVVNGSDNGNSFINQITMDGNQLDSWDKFVSVRGLHTNYHPSDPSRNNVDLVTDGDMGTAWAIIPATQGLELIEIVTLSKVNEIQITYGRPNQAPGLNIYENGVLKLSEKANRGSDLTPTQVTYSYSIPSTLYKYTFEVNVQNAGTIFVAGPIKANGTLLDSWDGFLAITGDEPDRSGSLSDIGSTTQAPTWEDVALTPGSMLWEITTSQRVKTFEINTYRYKYQPGWNIYENGVLLVSETSNGGSSDSPGNTDWFHTLDLRPHQLSFQSVTVDGSTIGSAGITVNGTTYTTRNVGRVQTDEYGFNYLEMTTVGRITMPAFVSHTTLISHTAYFVARAQDATGVIRRFLTKQSGSEYFNMHIMETYAATWPLIIEYPDGTSTGHFANDNDSRMTPLHIGSDIFVMVLKVEHTGTRRYNFRVQVASKPDGTTIEYGGMTSTLPARIDRSENFPTYFEVGTSDAQAEADNMKFYEYGVFNVFMDDASFDGLMQQMVDKYLTNAPSDGMYEYPPVEISSNTWTKSGNSPDAIFTTTVVGASYGNGEYVVQGTHFTDGRYDPTYNFNKQSTSGEDLWATGTKENAYLKITLPYSIKLQTYTIEARKGALFQSPLTWVLYGSNDNVTWDIVHRVDTSLTWTTDNEVKQFTVNSINSYNMYKWDSFTNDDAYNISAGEIRLYGRNASS